MSDEPSQFIFTLTNDLRLHEPEAHYGSSLENGDPSILETERNALRTSRVGQGIFRDGLLRLCGGGCAVTDYRRPALLLASHIKPWRTATNIERLDPYNGLLLQPTIDRLFDRGLVSFDDRGRLLSSSQLNAGELIDLGVSPGASLRMLPDHMRQYLKHHREHEFEKPSASYQELLRL